MLGGERAAHIGLRPSAARGVKTLPHCSWAIDKRLANVSFNWVVPIGLVRLDILFEPRMARRCSSTAPPGGTVAALAPASFRHA
jgi:hypothetical protein